MSRRIVSCRCGHQILAKEVLRTDLYERPAGRDYIYVKFRCRRCKRLGETFVAETRWDWSIFEPPPSEMTSLERDQFLHREQISEEEVAAFHNSLESAQGVGDLLSPLPEGQKTNAKAGAPAARKEKSSSRALADNLSRHARDSTPSDNLEHPRRAKGDDNAVRGPRRGPANNDKPAEDVPPGKPS